MEISSGNQLKEMNSMDILNVEISSGNPLKETNGTDNLNAKFSVEINLRKQMTQMN